MKKCKKARYPSELSVKLALLKIDRGGEDQERFFYRCPKCRGWHTTKMEQPVDAPTLAQQWHDDKVQMHKDAEELGNCWCCCAVCEELNPYFDDAKDGEDT